MKIKIKNIMLTGWNARKVLQKDPKVKELAETIKLHGLLQPILVRPHPTKEDHFQLIAGERRFVAHKVLKEEEIEATVRAMSEQEAKACMFTENASREDLTPFEEANAIAIMLKDGGQEVTPQEIAATLGWDIIRTKRRIQLMHLHESVREYAEQEGDIPITVLEAIASYPAEQQEGLSNWDIDRFGSAVQVHRSMGRMHRILGNASFDITSGMYGGIVACLECTKRTGCNPELFGNPEEEAVEDKCMDSECYKNKTLQNIAMVLEHKPDLILVRGYQESELYPDALHGDKYDTVLRSKAEPNALVVAGPDMGTCIRIKMVKPKKEAAKDTQVKKKPVKELTKKEAKSLLEEKKKERLGVIHRDAQNLIHEHFVKLKPTLVCASELNHVTALACIFGVSLGNWHDHGVLMGDAFDSYIDDGKIHRYGEETSVPLDVLAKAVIDEMRSYTGSQTGSDAMGRIKHHEQICALVGMEYSMFFEEALETKGAEPASWNPLKLKAGLDIGKPLIEALA